MNSVLIAEAIATAQRQTGKPVVTAEDVRLGLENLDITEARLEELGLKGFMPPLKDDLRGPLGRTTTSTSSNGTAAPGRRRPTGSRR